MKIMLKSFSEKAKIATTENMSKSEIYSSPFKIIIFNGNPKKIIELSQGHFKLAHVILVKILFRYDIIKSHRSNNIHNK